MYSFSLDLTATARSLVDLVLTQGGAQVNADDLDLVTVMGNGDPLYCDFIIQAPAANAGNVLIGGRLSQDWILAAGGSTPVLMRALDVQKVYVRGTAGDSIVVAVFIN